METEEAIDLATMEFVPESPYMPIFWKDEISAANHAEFEIDCAEMDLTNPETQELLEARMLQTFVKIGLVHLVNTGQKSLEDMRKMAGAIVTDPMEYKGGANARNGIVPNVYETGAPKEAHLHYHHEMAYVSKSTSMLAFLCEHHVANKGWSFVSDQVALTKYILATPFGQKLRDRGLCYIRCLTDRDAYLGQDESNVYNHWQKSFGVDTPEEVEVLARERGLRCEWGEDPVLGPGGGRYLVTRFYVSAFEYCPATDSNVMYSSVADDAMWFDGWPGLRALPNHQRPLKLTFGDDSEFSKAEFREWVDAYDLFGVPIKWRTGDVVVVCNWRWAHGRPAYSLEEGEQRQLGVMLGQTFNRVQHRDDKWPAL